MKLRFLLPVLSLALLLPAGCSSLITSKVPAPVYYQPEYKATPVPCKVSFNQGLRVWKFSTASPYDQTDMVVTLPQGKAQFSGTYQWVASPGSMVAQDLARDLSAGDLFPLVVIGNNPIEVPLELTGRVYRFAWMKKGKTARAELEVEMSLVDSDAHEVLFHQIYNFQGASFATGADDSAQFAKAMGALIGRLSEQFRRDLCRAAEESASQSGEDSSTL